MNIDVPKVSVLIPVFNGGRYLRDCLRSLERQTYQDFEVLLGDDGSTDLSLQIAAEFASPRLKLLPVGSRLGLFANVNRLMAASKGKCVRVLCQDDVLESDCLELEVAFLESHPEVGMVISKTKLMDSEGAPISESTLNDLPSVLSPSLALQQLYYHGCLPGNLSAVMFRRSVIEKTGPFDPHFSVSGDYEMWARICFLSFMGILHQRTLTIRSHVGQLSRHKKSSIAFIRENRRVRLSILSRLPLEVQPGASLFERKRQNVLDFHYALRQLLAGHVGQTLQVFQILGVRESLVALFYWLVTLNNRVNYPRPVWLIPAK